MLSVGARASAPPAPTWSPGSGRWQLTAYRRGDRYHPAAREITEDAAFEMVRDVRQGSNRKLRDVADDVVMTGVAPAPIIVSVASNSVSTVRAAVPGS